MRKLFVRQAAAALILLSTASALGNTTPGNAREDVYLAPEQFLAEALGAAHKPATLWITAPIKAHVTRILGHPPAQLRQRYWTDGARTAWILEEIGKEEFITAGFLVADGRIDQARVLIYRESRGYEIRYPAFLKQFDRLGLQLDGQLSGRIDNISGATLSVNAMMRMARVALYFDQLANAK